MFGNVLLLSLHYFKLHYLVSVLDVQTMEENFATELRLLEANTMWTALGLIRVKNGLLSNVSRGLFWRD